MSYNTYSEYDDTDIIWAKQLPAHWETNRFKIVFSYSKGKNPQSFFDDAKEGLAPYLSMEYLRNDIDPTYVPVKECPLRANVGDILLLWDGSNAGEFVISKEGLVSSTMAKLTPNIFIDKHFSKYLCKSIEPLLRELTIGMGVPHVSTTELNNIVLPRIPLEEQQQIANYLDKQTVKIEAIIAKNEELIQLLEEKRVSLINQVVTKGLNPDVPTKDSGVEWIGEIPKHWGITRGKTILNQLKRNVKSNDEVITCFRDGEVTLRSKRRETGFTMSDKEIGYQGIERNDLVIHGMDGFAGAIGISDSRGKGSPVLIVLDSKHDKKYLMYYLRNLAYNNVFLALSTGIRVRSCDLRWDKLANLPYLIPPITEQKEISSYLDQEVIRIYKTIDKIKKHNELLEEYKTSLIHHVVTGKIDVRGEEI